jgi:hypothetical protein
MDSLETFTLAPLSSGDLIDRAVRLYRRNFVSLLLIVLGPSLVAYAGAIAYTLGVRNFTFMKGELRLALAATLVVIGIVLYVLGKVAFFALLGGTAQSLVRYFSDGERLSPRAVYSSVRANFWPLVRATVVVFVLLVGVIALVYTILTAAILVYMFVNLWLIRGLPTWLQVVSHIIFGIVMLVGAVVFFLLVYGRIVYVPQALVVEKRGALSAIGRSITLAGTDLKRIGAILLFESYVAWSLLLLLLIPLGWYGLLRGISINPLSSDGPLWFDVAYHTMTQVSEILLAPIVMLGLSLLYIDTRVRREGLDIEILARRNLRLNPPEPGTPVVELSKGPANRSPVLPHLALAGLLLLTSQKTLAAASLEDYQRRVAAAAKLGEHISEMSAAGSQRMLQEIQLLLPATEEVAFRDQQIHVDNHWLYQASSAPDRSAQLKLIEERLRILDDRLEQVKFGSDQRIILDDGPDHGRLDSILARPEYQREVARESIVLRWLRSVRRAFLDLLSRLFSVGERKPRPPSRLTLIIAETLTYLALAAVLLLIIRRFGPRLARFARKPRAVTGAQSSGEILAIHQTPAELLREAARFAEKQDYRKAIRSAFLALLADLDGKGKLNLRAASTNRDYLNELQTDGELFRTVEGLTGTFESVWYGRTAVSSSDYEGFRNRLPGLENLSPEATGS